jgi:hypothetical protein
MSLYYQTGSTPKNLGGAIVLYHNNDSRFDGVDPISSYEVTGFGSRPYNGNDAEKSLLGYIFAKNTNSLLAMRSSDPVGNTYVFQNASIYPSTLRSIHYVEAATTTKTASAIRGGRFNVYTGKFSVGFPNSSTDTFGTDNAARSSFAIPGSLTFMVNGKQLTTQNYPAKG